MSRKLIVGNWKMNGSLAANAALLGELKAGLRTPPACDVVVCPPSVYLAQVQALCAGMTVEWGAQDVSSAVAGARTGETSAEMLADFGARWCIVGHSERRAYHGESDLDVAHKAQRLLAVGITPIVCVGESVEQRAQGRTEAVVSTQLRAVIDMIPDSLAQLVVAYEPIWAIGTGVTATPEQAAQVHAHLRAQLHAADPTATVRVLYGGSMNAANAASLLAQDEINGGLIGGAALRAADFLQIIAAA